jgi:hypothetical protein
MRTLILALAVLTFAVPARAQFSQPPPEPEAPPASAPPPAPPASNAAAAKLAERGQHKKVVGASLIVLGAVLTAGGIALLIGDAVETAFCSGDCLSFNPLLISSVAFDIAGTGLLGAGIPTYIVGGAQMNQGQRMLGLNLACRF